MTRQYWNQDVSDSFQKVYLDPRIGYVGPFDALKPALRFGWNHALASEYPNETWEEVEEDLERAWVEAHPQHGTWQEMKQYIHHAWDQARADWKGLVSKARSE